MGNTKTPTEVRRALNVRHGRGANWQKDTTYTVWKGMIARAHTASSHDADRYYGRGIRVCERWQIFDNFFADMGERPAGMSLDRIDNDGDYSPENCRWTSMKEQARNKSNNRMLTANGETMCVAAWAERMGVSRQALRYRLEAGWSPEDAVSVNINYGNGKKPYRGQNSVAS